MANPKLVAWVGPHRLVGQPAVDPNLVVAHLGGLPATEGLPTAEPQLVASLGHLDLAGLVAWLGQQLDPAA